MKIAIDILPLLLGKGDPRTVPEALRAVGRRDKHRGPSWEFAEVEVVVEPASRWEGVVFEPEDPTAKEMVSNGWIEATAMGILDELIVKSSPPIANVRVRIVRVQADPIDSSAVAFKNAGSEAGKDIRSQIEAVATPDRL